MFTNTSYPPKTFLRIQFITITINVFSIITLHRIKTMLPRIITSQITPRPPHQLVSRRKVQRLAGSTDNCDTPISQKAQDFIPNRFVLFHSWVKFPMASCVAVARFITNQSYDAVSADVVGADAMKSHVIDW